MRVDVLHRLLANDVRVMHDAVDKVLPMQMPTCYEHRQLNLKSFVNRLNVITEPLGVYNEQKEDKSIDLGTVTTSGLWLGKDELPENDSRADIRIIWHAHPETKRIDMTPAEWLRRRYFFWQMFMHELVHRHQDTFREPDVDIRVYRPRSTVRDIKEEQEYYGNHDEIEAHAHDAAVEFHTWWNGLPYRNAIHEAVNYSGRLVMPVWCFYRATFDSSPGHPAMKSFRRKTRAWYDVIKKNPDIYELIKLPSLVV